MTGILLMLAMAAELELSLPKDYREWVFMSSGVGMTYGPAAAASQGAPLFDNVFVNPEAWKEFKKTGVWPDRTTFILEIRYAASQGSINKAGNYQTDISAVELAQRQGDEWNYYTFGNAMRGLREKAGPLPRSAGCVACHSTNGAVQWTFSQFYPEALAIAKAKGTVKASYQPPVDSPAAFYHRIVQAGWVNEQPQLAAARAKDPNAAVSREGQLNFMGYNLLMAGKTRDAIGLFRFVTEQFPQSANAQDSLAEALEKSGDPTAALEASRKCLALAGPDDRAAKSSQERIARLSKN